MVCTCEETGSIFGCAGCDVQEEYFPTAEELEAGEADYYASYDRFEGEIVDDFE